MSASLLVANRGEIALRIIRTATELGMRTIAVYADDDAQSPHVHAADEAIVLPGSGPRAYLDQSAMLAVAKRTGADLIHPGYGFLSENAEFADACVAGGVTFVGPDPGVLGLLGNKTAARGAALAAGVPVLPATDGASSVEEVAAFFAAQRGGIMLKALAGGGGRGMRKVHRADQIDDAYQRCAAEAQLGFGDPALYAEALLDDARHIEVQVVAAPAGHQTHALAVGDRDCSIQRRYQKLVEIAPAQGLSDELRRALHQAAVRLCARVGLRGLATVEFLVTGEDFVFLEANPRIQVEQTPSPRKSPDSTWWPSSWRSPAARPSTGWGCRPASRPTGSKSSASRPPSAASRFSSGSTRRHSGPTFRCCRRRARSRRSPRPAGRACASTPMAGPGWP